MSLRYRLWLLFAPLLLLLAVLGAGFVYALGVVGDRVEAILRENYRSVEAMTGRTAARFRAWAAAGLLVALAATGLRAWRAGRTILRPVEDLTRSARAVGDGRFDQMVTARTGDEIGALVAAFNRMTAQLRDLRQ